MKTSIWWIRRDMRVEDNAALCAAAGDGHVVPVFVIDPKFAAAGIPRQAFMYGSLSALDDSMGGALIVRSGDPTVEIPRIAHEVGAHTVHIASDYAPYGRARDARVASALAKGAVALVESDSPYVVRPGTVLKDDGTPLKVFTPFFKRWSQVSWGSVINPSVDFAHTNVDREALPVIAADGLDLPGVGEANAWHRWEEWSPRGLSSYKGDRDNPGIDGTSRMSAYLRFGIVHPRQLLSTLDGSAGADHFRSEIAWREFYADVLFHQPDTMWKNLQRKMDVLPVDSGPRAEAKFETFCRAQTGYPVVDAGIRQMLATGFMHNRVRMIVASFLVKDLHLPWQWGARFFMKHLVDGDIASNNHGWQWTAGTGTDAAPYFRVFNPTSQSQKFDPSGAYLRRWIPEIADVDDAHIHDPSTLGLLAPASYPAPMVDHAQERNEALSRYKSVSGK